MIVHFGWIEDEHPRDLKGRFKGAVAALKSGEHLLLPDHVRVTRVRNGYHVTSVGAHPNRFESSHHGAAQRALDMTARSPNVASLGGPESFNDFEDYGRKMKQRKKA